ncbi:hypothetical protein NUW54_g3962 [Trametes sanguinea]|uniref:Uncharacterized protein n=1 Tax=Trametes sanguinea TaxID=158606 RepID=A0ACC1PZF5_9APHY|nr:hypothetical protein NUW54_g3962 [Trametes sanguinea]
MTALPALPAVRSLLESVHLHAAGSVVVHIAPFLQVDEGSVIYANVLRVRKLVSAPLCALHLARAAADKMADLRRQVVSLPGSIFDPFPTTSTTDTTSSTDPSSLTSDPTVTVTATNTVVVTDPSSTSMANLPGTRLSLNPTATSTDPQPSGGSFAFSEVPFMTACTTAYITWTYNGPAESFDLLASTSISPHPDGSSTDTSVVMNAPVALGIPASLQSYSWTPVNLTAGWYTLRAAGDDFSVASGQFFVENAIPPPQPPPHRRFRFQSPMRYPRTRAQVLLLGGVIGGLAIIGAAIAAYIYFGVCRRRPTRSRRGSGRPGQLGKWGGLSSRDSGMDVGLPVSSVPTSGKPPLVVGVGLPKRRATTDSTGAILTPLSSTAHGHSLTASRGASDEDVSSIGHEEKVVSSRGLEFFEAVPPSRRRSSTSGSSAMTPIPEPPSAHSAYGRNRARSPSQSHRALALAKLDGDSALSSSVPPRPSPRSPPAPRRSVDSMQLRTFDTPPVPMQSPLAQASPMSRSASGNGPRRAARKPVPTLTEADMVPPTSASLTSPSVTSASTSASSANVSVADSRSPTASPHPMYRNNSGSGSGSTLLCLLALSSAPSHPSPVAISHRRPCGGFMGVELFAMRRTNHICISLGDWPIGSPVPIGCKGLSRLVPRPAYNARQPTPAAVPSPLSTPPSHPPLLTPPLPPITMKYRSPSPDNVLPTPPQSPTSSDMSNSTVVLLESLEQFYQQERASTPLPSMMPLLHPPPHNPPSRLHRPPTRTPRRSTHQS